MASTPIRILAGCLFLLTLLAFATGGFAIAIFVNSNSRVVYESHAVFHITPRWIAGNGVSASKVEKLVNLCDMPHGERLTSRSLIKSCLTVNQLFQLDSFVDQSEEQSIVQTLENLEVSQISEDANVYKVVLHAANPQDSAVIANSLISSYYEKLNLEVPDMQGHFAFRLLEVARIGDQIYPVLPINISIGVGAAVLIAAALWFSLNPFKFKYPPISLGEMIGVSTLILLFTAAGMALAWRLEGTSDYESASTVLIQDNAIDSAPPKTEQEKRLVELSRIPNGVLFSQYRHIERALENGNLFILDIFAGMGKEEVVCHVQKNLTIVSDPVDSNLFEITYRADNPENCQQVLETLIAAYSNFLDEQYDTILRVSQNKNEAARIGNAPAEFGLPIQYQTKVLKPATDAVSVFGNPSSWIACLFTGFTAGLLILAVWLVWRATRDLGNTNQYSAT